MGIFDKVKSFANKLTGGSAKVFVEAEPFRIGEPIQVKIKAIVQDESISIDRVYLIVEGLEEVRVHDQDFTRNQSGNLRTTSETIHRTHRTYVNEINVSGEMNLAATMTYDWTTSVEIPVGSNPIYRGRYAQHIYRIKAGLDMSGNDPDSGWAELK